jgi:hypothetical protein
MLDIYVCSDTNVNLTLKIKFPKVSWDIEGLTIPSRPIWRGFLIRWITSSCVATLINKNKEILFQTKSFVN